LHGQLFNLDLCDACTIGTTFSAVRAGSKKKTPKPPGKCSSNAQLLASDHARGRWPLPGSAHRGGDRHSKHQISDSFSLSLPCNLVVYQTFGVIWRARQDYSGDFKRTRVRLKKEEGETTLLLFSLINGSQNNIRLSRFSCSRGLPLVLLYCRSRSSSFSIQLHYSTARRRPPPSEGNQNSPEFQSSQKGFKCDLGHALSNSSLGNRCRRKHPLSPDP
jgi:hypothetical protein